MPAGHIETGSATDLGFGLRCVPRDMSFGEGVRGVLKGCAAPVEVVAGGAEGVKREVVWEKARKRDGAEGWRDEDEAR